MFKITTPNFEYEPASPGFDECPTYLVTPRNRDGMCIELFYTKAYVKKDQLGLTITDRAWKLIEYDRNDDSMDEYWFLNFDDADAHAHKLWVDSYSID